ncbi:GH25 family lysozyme [Aureimonas sp. Leaf324]|uniref:glycoside hydrolase family 25 protein n=1 Tax=Aureimonas sp. Leaf324 TaxID=1736336 RepID=UPI0006F7FA27|nr:GH25 family lysozyme [Aureimonas sp. Leaf324]KQQ86016.1 glycosyl hydrolase family 25 [Aureimonas sp. Leaf324]
MRAIQRLLSRAAFGSRVLLVVGAALAVAGCRSASLDPVDLGLTGVAGTQPHHYPVHGIDVSKYQGKIAWDTVRAGGVAFAYIKSTEGGDRVDSAFRRNWDAAGAAGVPRGAYHFFYWCRSGAEQARWFIENVPRDPAALPPVLDVEWTPDSPTCTRRPPREEMVREMTAFMDTLEKHYGVRPIIYAPIDIHRDRLIGTFPKHQFWLRGVKDHPSVNYAGREDWRFWQWTATGTVPGVSGEVDRNAFSGTKADWETWLRAHRPAA